MKKKAIFRATRSGGKKEKLGQTKTAGKLELPRRDQKKYKKKKK